MKLHKLRGNLYAIKEREHCDDFWLAYKFDFGMLKLNFQSASSIENVKLIADRNDGDLINSWRSTIDAAESIYTLLDESIDTVQTLNILAEEIAPAGFDIFFDSRVSCELISQNSTRLFVNNGNSFQFELQDGTERVKFTIGKIDPHSSVSCNKALHMLTNLCTHKLSEIYKTDRTRTHLAKYQNRYFSAELGL